MIRFKAATLDLSQHGFFNEESAVTIGQGLVVGLGLIAVILLFWGLILTQQNVPGAVLCFAAVTGIAAFDVWLLFFNPWGRLVAEALYEGKHPAKEKEKRERERGLFDLTTREGLIARLKRMPIAPIEDRVLERYTTGEEGWETEGALRAAGAEEYTAADLAGRISGRQSAITVYFERTGGNPKEVRVSTSESIKRDELEFIIRASNFSHSVTITIFVARIGEDQFKAWLHQSAKGYSRYLGM